MESKPSASTRGRLRPRGFDVAAILLSLLAVGVSSVVAYSRASGDSQVIIEASGSRWIYPLGQDREVRVGGPLGDELVAIRDGHVSVGISPCPRKICILQGEISRPGQWIACLPNRIFIRIEGKGAGGADDVSY